MAYVELTDLTGEIPPQFLTQGLDDNNDGIIDAWTVVQAHSFSDVDDILESRFAVQITLSPLPGIIKRAAIAFACYRIYRRRSTPDKDNPFFGTMGAFQKTLRAIADGTIKLSVLPHAEDAAVDPAASVITVQSEMGRPGRRILG